MSEIVEKVLELGMETRIRAGAVHSNYRRGNIASLRRGRKAARKLQRVAAELAAAAYQADDVLDREIRALLNRCDT